MKYIIQRYSSIRFVFLALLGILIVLPLFLSLQTTAHAAIIPAASCGGSKNNCDGKDPNNAGCTADAFTTGGIIHLVDQSGQRSELGYAENRYSPSCQTNWTRITLESCGTTSSCLVTITITRQSDGHEERFFNNDGAGYNVIWTNMVYAPSPEHARACARLGNGSSVSLGNDQDPNDPSLACSGWH